MTAKNTPSINLKYLSLIHILPFKVSAKVMTSLLFLSYTPLNCFPEPIGQLIGHDLCRYLKGYKGGL